MKKETKTRFSSIYWQQFSLIAGVVLLTLLLLGASFYALSYNYLVGEKRDEMKMRAQLIVQLTSDYIMANGEDEGPEQRPQPHGRGGQHDDGGELPHLR